MYAPQQPSNTQGGLAQLESDPTAELFNADYVFGAEIFPIDSNPPPMPSNDVSSAMPPDPWYTLSADQAPTPAATSGITSGANSAWIYWPPGAASILLSTPDGSDIRSIWFRSATTAITVTAGPTMGSVMVQLDGKNPTELVPVPAGCPQVTLWYQDNAVSAGIYVFVTGDTFSPTQN